MKQKTVYLLLLIHIINIDCSPVKKNTVEKHAKSKLNWQGSPIMVDGSSVEWDKSQMEFDQKSNLAYNFTNDADNVYVLLITYDNRTQIKILNAGMSLYIDAEGKKKENTVIDYPLEFQKSFSYFQQELNSEIEDEKKSALLDANKYVLRGFKIGDGLYSTKDENRAAIKVKIGIDSMNKMVYEAMIPLASVYNGKNAASAGKYFSLGFIINGLTQSDINEVIIEPSNLTSRIKMNNIEKDDIHILSQTVKIWKKVTLASK